MGKGTGGAGADSNNRPSGPLRGFLRPFLWICLVCSVIFVHTVREREPWFGVLAIGHHQWLSAASLHYLQNWWEEGAWHLGFRMVFNPASIEFASLEERGLYASGPSGALLPPYLLARLTGHPPSFPLLMAWNLANHWMVALCLAMLVFRFLRGLGIAALDSFLLALIPPALELLLPGPMFMHQNVYFGPTAMLLPFVLAVFLESGLERAPDRDRRGLILGFQFLVYLYGYLSSWQFFFVGLVVYFKRILADKDSRRDAALFVRRTLLFWAPFLLAMGLFAIQLSSYGGFRWIWGRFLVRTGLQELALDDRIVGDFESRFWGRYLPEQYGAWLTLALLVSAVGIGALWAISRRKPGPAKEALDRIAGLSALLVLPPLAFTYLFLNSSFIHDFEGLKFSPAIACVPLVLFPVAFLAYFSGFSGSKGPFSGRWGKVAFSRILALALLSLCVLAVWREHPRYRRLFPEPDLRMAQIGNFIRDNTAYEDVVFSPTLEIPEEPPQLISYSRKRVYLIHRWEEIWDRIRDLPPDCRVVLLIFQGDNPIPLKVLKKYSEQVVQEGDLFLYRLPSRVFREKFAGQGRGAR